MCEESDNLTYWILEMEINTCHIIPWITTAVDKHKKS